VEGHSNDGTYEECLRVKDSYRDRKIRTFQQPGKGKGDAIRLGFAHAQGEVVLILDADLTVPPESVPKFYRVLVEGHGEFVNGTRLVYPMSDRAMRTLQRDRKSCLCHDFLISTEPAFDRYAIAKALWKGLWHCRTPKLATRSLGFDHLGQPSSTRSSKFQQRTDVETQIWL
jgi:glycosyltransferase involved in cell wall biosynthesis